eukprot:TRINITY_DN65518_c0_g1_i1.p1 TRINITY_DN65518_c0_g1~~TRINITY_DN65518_c0_g1_i1.p1  ORF type:complete len:682 (-),score=109.72 TRINITY_DN65518_c0_g1_i1:224-2269(-)
MMSRQLKTAISLLYVASFVFLQSKAHTFETGTDVSEGDVTQNLMEQLHSTVAKGVRWSKLHKDLEPTFNSLPKNEKGHLDHQAVRYALHRLFVKRHGWFIKGLEPNDETWHHDHDNDASTPNRVKEWVPSFLQEVLEEHLHHEGVNLASLVAFAAALEDVISNEMRIRLEVAYKVHELPLDGELTFEEATDVIETWYVSFLLAGKLSSDSADEVHKKKEVFATKYSGWKEAKDFLLTLAHEHYSLQENTRYTFAANMRMVQRIAEQYYEFNDRECKDLKTTLTGLETQKAGRVRLSNFYNASLYSHWKFTEKADYLKTLGALDESDPQQSQVIVPNYIMARPNCLEASGFFSVCCRNECEDLMGHVESSIKGSVATPKDIVKVLQEEWPHQPYDMHLDDQTESRLHEVADMHGGKVPIHGRLFAQWMHHVFPRECPYPAELGTVSPLTPDEWMAKSGHKDYSATEEEMKLQLESDVCTVDEHGNPKSGCQETEDLPWSSQEQLLTDPVALARPERLHVSEELHPLGVQNSVDETDEPPWTPQEEDESPLEEDLQESFDNVSREINSRDHEEHRHPRIGKAFACVMSIICVLSIVWDYLRLAFKNVKGQSEVFYVDRISQKDLNHSYSGLTKAFACWALLLLAWFMDVLDTAIVGVAMCSGLLLQVGRHIYMSYATSKQHFV